MTYVDGMKRLPIDERSSENIQAARENDFYNFAGYSLLGYYCCLEGLHLGQERELHRPSPKGRTNGAKTASAGE